MALASLFNRRKAPTDTHSFDGRYDPIITERISDEHFPVEPTVELPATDAEYAERAGYDDESHPQTDYRHRSAGRAPNTFAFAERSRFEPRRVSPLTTFKALQIISERSGLRMLYQ